MDEIKLKILPENDDKIEIEIKEKEKKNQTRPT